MATIILSAVIFIVAVFLLSLGVIFSKNTRLKKSCSGGLGPHRVGEDGKEIPCGTCHCRPAIDVKED